MARFIARVELHADGDYEALHEGMKGLGFLREAPDTDVPPLPIELPPATYYRAVDHEMDLTRSLAVAIHAVGVKANKNRPVKLLVVKAAGGAEDVYPLGFSSPK